MELLSTSTLGHHNRHNNGDGLEMLSEATQTVTSPGAESCSSGASTTDRSISSDTDKIDDDSTDGGSVKGEDKMAEKVTRAGIEPMLPLDDELSVVDVPLDDREYNPDDIISCLSAFSGFEEDEVVLEEDGH
ncbi:hypothetical protein FOL47_011011 [Perkinsus chesapeaki]|uniref:Uncharacterized protein n=1 Tax=Perkinsus chesapeaki TaxID=330153 RepID=A0A7J6L066_PERCH|nr:hypothetical protein FOL47_011011 [Perkinsus chesapeaki]